MTWLQYSIFYIHPTRLIMHILSGIYDYFLLYDAIKCEFNQIFLKSNEVYKLRSYRVSKLNQNSPELNNWTIFLYSTIIAPLTQKSY
jgi:effector-binding domain-containing protein